MIKLKILLPYKVFFESDIIKSLIVEGPQGFIGILPKRLDCVTSLVPGIMTMKTTEGEFHFAIDEGVLTKFGDEVYISVRDAVAGASLAELKDAVEKDFAKRMEDESNLKMVLSKLEVSFARRLMEFSDEI